jgi:AraC family transcriptional regulator
VPGTTNGTGNGRYALSRYTVVHEGSGWSLGLWRCEAPEPGTHAPERATHHLIVFPTHGGYARRIEGVRELLDASRVVYFNADEWYEVDHPFGGGDRCTVLSLEPELVASIAGAGTALDRTGSTPRFAATSRASSGPLHLAQRMLSARGLSTGADPIALDAQAFQVIDAALPRGGKRSSQPSRAAGRTAGPQSATTKRTATAEHHRRAVERALEKIHAEHRSALSLAEIARAAAYSPFHFCRLFRAQVGVSLHRYLNRLRLREALEEVMDCRSDLGPVALRYGFSSHSHFSEAFRREFGRAPTFARRGTAPAIGD